MGTLQLLAVKRIEMKLKKQANSFMV